MSVCGLRRGMMYFPCDHQVHFGGADRCVLLSTHILVYGSCYDEADHTGAALRAGRVALIDMKGDGRMAMNGEGRMARILDARIL